MSLQNLYCFLEEKTEQYNHIDFVATDPISIPHRFGQLQDIEIAAFWTAMLAWGQRKTIINKATTLFAMMDNAPHDFVLHHSEKDLSALLQFKHRTFNAVDVAYFLRFLRHHYQQHNSLETAFVATLSPQDTDVGNALRGFYDYFFFLESAPQRTRKHIATPARQSACKRLNMFLRWMVRRDNKGVDFGLWQHISPSQLLIPLDVHVDRIARQLGLLQSRAADWKAVLQLTEVLRQFDPLDPAKYDFALFGLGLEGYFEQK
ncbi:MAG: TIGR02757 family protein [Chitinophagales bacterium]|nr:TIGR02757 family protein [Chitinophagales bacterium]